MRGARRLAPAVLVLAAGCGTEPIPIAILPSDAGTVEASGDAQVEAGGPACTTNADCPSHTFCAVENCALCLNGACLPLTTGTCQPMPETCPENDPASPVCGCDSFTYYTDCLRRKAGVASITSAHACGSPVCYARVFGDAGADFPPCPGMCSGVLLGNAGAMCRDQFAPLACWIVPSPCPRTPTSFVDGCEDRSISCLDLCTAVTRGGSYQQSSLSCHR